eukprot:CAMPEP_0194573422 /NCGR_PEP_ID=MMETSP0292-20121207/9641_1 /TAXON_ID=39354 /ORGANISM="Heterosigma akashiwo, Strain CCMP2393" /LENGTH=420 /DNA_ID=CAMNT_0039424663 /DNA_START=27 /DNA_END=1289 /DNA_ORIENTATION=-
MGNQQIKHEQNDDKAKWRRNSDTGQFPEMTEESKSTQDNKFDLQNKRGSLTEALDGARKRASSVAEATKVHLEKKKQEFNKRSKRKGVTKDLYRCAMFGDVKHMEKCMQLGDDLHAIDKYGRNAFHYACMGGNAIIIGYLTEQGVKNDVKDQDGLTPLHWVASTDSPEIIQVMSDYGVDLDTKDHYGNSALHAACKKRKIMAVTRLLKCGADPNITNNDGKTPKKAMSETNDVPANTKHKINTLLKTIKPAKQHSPTVRGRARSTSPLPLAAAGKLACKLGRISPRSRATSTLETYGDGGGASPFMPPSPPLTPTVRGSTKMPPRSREFSTTAEGKEEDAYKDGGGASSLIMPPSPPLTLTVRTSTKTPTWKLSDAEEENTAEDMMVPNKGTPVPVGKAPPSPGEWRKTSLPHGGDHLDV